MEPKRLQRMLIEENNAGNTFQIGTYYPSQGDEVKVLIQPKLKEEVRRFHELRAIAENNVLRPVTLVKYHPTVANLESGIKKILSPESKKGKTENPYFANMCFKRPRCCMSEIEKHILFDCKDCITITYRKIMFDFAKLLSSLHLKQTYHGNLTMSNTLFDANYNLKISDLTGTSPTENLTFNNLEAMKDADWYAWANMVELTFKKHNVKLPAALSSMLKDLMGVGGANKAKVPQVDIFSLSPFWWSYGHKQTCILEADMTWDRWVLDASKLSWPKELNEYLKEIQKNPSESHHKYKPTTSSFVHYLKNKITHPEFFKLFPATDVEGNADRFLDYIEEWWPNIWVDLLKHKKIAEH